MDNESSLETCSRCKFTYKNDGKFYCPQCGTVHWGQIIVLYAFSILCIWLFFFVASDIASNFWRGVVRWSTGIFGIFSAIAAFVATSQVKVAKQLASEYTGKAAVVVQPEPVRSAVAAASWEAKPVKEVPLSDVPVTPVQVVLPENVAAQPATVSLQKTSRFTPNPEHVDKWKEGIDAWTAWREQNPDIHPELCGASLMGTELAGADLNSADLREADLRDCDLTLVYIKNANLSGAILMRTNLSYCVTSGATNFEKADLNLANLNGANLEMVNLANANLKIADLSDANLSDARLQSANLSFARLDGTNLSQADLRGSNFSNTDLNYTNLRMAMYDRHTIWPAGFSPLAAGALEI